MHEDHYFIVKTQHGLRRKETGNSMLPWGVMTELKHAKLLVYFYCIVLEKCSIKKIGLYRDDGLACFENNDGHQNDKIRKELLKIFQRNGLKLDIKCNLKVVDYLDITFDLKTGSYKLYRKPNNDTRYINSKSNHPPTILKQIPTAIPNRISTNSSNEEIFKNSAPYYNNNLKESGYKEKLQFQPNKHHPTSRRNRSRNIIWFNPPYSINVETNVARRFLNLVKKHFSKHRYHKILIKTI